MSKYTILWVDDSRATLTIGQEMISSLDMEFIEATDGRKALDILQDHPEVDAIILDLNMPVMDGEEFLAEFHSRTDIPHPPVILCTTEADMQRVAEALRCGAEACVHKPFNGGILRETLTGVGVCC